LLNNIAKDLQGLSAPLSNLKLAEKNPRKGDVEAIKKSYERFGQRKPIVAHRKTKVIIAGNHQYQAARDLGWDKIAVVWVDDNDETATAYSIADNRIGQLGEWDVEELVSAFEMLDPSDLESVGFTQIDVEDYRALVDENIGSAPATVMDGGLGDRTSKKDGKADLQVEQTNTYDEFLERYASRAVRAIMLYYPNDVYKGMVEDFARLAEIMGADDTATVVERLVKERLSNE